MFWNAAGLYCGDVDELPHERREQLMRKYDALETAITAATPPTYICLQEILGTVARFRENRGLRQWLGGWGYDAALLPGAQPSCRRAACGAELERVRGQRSGRAAAARDGHAAGGEEAVGFGGRLRGAHRSLLASGLARQHERAHCPDGPKTQTEARPSVTASDGRWVGMR